MCGALILFISALNIYGAVGGEAEAVGGDTRGDNEYPWQVTEPTVFEPDATTYSGWDSGLIRIPLEEHDQAPYAVTLVSNEFISLYITEAEDLGQPANDRNFPASAAYVSGVGDEALILPRHGDLELWVRTNGPWEFTLQKAEVTEIRDGFATGTGAGTRHLVYRGDAVSAHFSHRGTGVFFVTIQAPDDSPDQPITASGDIDERKSWDPTTDVYFTIETDDRNDSAWSVDIDELATDDPTRPATSTFHPTASRQPRGTTPR